MTAGAISGAAGGAAAGAAGGGLGAAIYGGNIGKAMLTGAGIGAAVGGIMGAIGGSLDGNQNASTMQKMYTENPAFTRASFDGLTVDIQGAEVDPNAISVCMKPLEGKGGVASQLSGKYHVFIWDGPNQIGYGLAPVPEFSFGIGDYFAGRYVPGWIKPELTLDGTAGCRFITNDAGRMANIRGLVREATKYYHWYNHPARNCYWWANDIVERSLAMPRSL